MLSVRFYRFIFSFVVCTDLFLYFAEIGTHQLISIVLRERKRLENKERYEHVECCPTSIGLWAIEALLVCPSCVFFCWFVSLQFLHKAFVMIMVDVAEHLYWFTVDDICAYEKVYK